MTAIPLNGSNRLYERTAAAADRDSWSVNRDIRWSSIDREHAFDRPKILAALRDAALIESYHAVNLAQLLTAMWDDVDAGVVLSLEMHDGLKHFHSLRRYLEEIGYNPLITDAELVEIRRKQAPLQVNGDLMERLVELMLSEHVTHYFFRRLGEQAADPVLADLLGRISADCVRNAQGISDLIAKRIAVEPQLIPRVLDAAVDFHHFGERAIRAVPIALPGDPIAIQTFARRIERLCGRRLVDHIKQRI